MSEKHRPRIIHGQPSWRLASKDVEAFVTEVGGHLGPVVFDRRGGKFSPLAVAPWAEESTDPNLLPVLRVLRGDFFCLPFGGNATPYRGERHLPHGETANGRWAFESLDDRDRRTTLHLSMDVTARPGRVDKYISVVEGQSAVYSRHVISGMSGRMNLGHHAILKFPPKPGSGLVSTSPFLFGQVYGSPVEMENGKSRSALLPGARFSSLDQVPTVRGRNTDLGRYPARRGYEDIAMLVSDPNLPFAWTAVSFPSEGYAWFALKNPRVLRQTLFWFSNGGRNYAPWNGRHLDTMGLEEVTSCFHDGLAESARENAISETGSPTCISLGPKQPCAINYIMGAVRIPTRFRRVTEIVPGPDGVSVILRSTRGQSVQTPIDLSFLA